MDEGEYCWATPFKATSCFMISSIFMPSNAITTWRVLFFIPKLFHFEFNRKSIKLSSPSSESVAARGLAPQARLADAP